MSLSIITSEKHKNTFKKTVKAINMITLYYLIFHIFSCFCMFIGVFENSDDFQQAEEVTITIGWISKLSNLITEENFRNLYLRAFYFVITNFATVGYGDILPVTMTEYMYMIVLMMSS